MRESFVRPLLAACVPAAIALALFIIAFAGQAVLLSAVDADADTARLLAEKVRFMESRAGVLAGAADSSELSEAAGAFRRAAASIAEILGSRPLPGSATPYPPGLKGVIADSQELLQGNFRERAADFLRIREAAGAGGSPAEGAGQYGSFLHLADSLISRLQSVSEGIADARGLARGVFLGVQVFAAVLGTAAFVFLFLFAARLRREMAGVITQGRSRVR